MMLVLRPMKIIQLVRLRYMKFIVACFISFNVLLTIESKLFLIQNKATP